MRLIDADALMQALGIFKDYEHGNPHFMNGIETNRELVLSAPTIDAEPVVRCKNCWKRGYDNCPLDDWLDTHTLDPDFFCALGEPEEMRPGFHRGVKTDGGET